MDSIKDVEDKLTSLVPKKPKSKQVADISDREARFIHEYCTSMNKVDAYRRAYHTKEFADEVALKADALLNTPEIERRIKNELAKKLDSTLMTAPHFLMKYIQEIIELDIADFYEDDGIHLKPLSSIAPEKRKYVRMGRPTTNSRTGDVYAIYELPTFSSALDKLLDVVKLVTQAAANNPNSNNGSEEARERRERILNGID